MRALQKRGNCRSAAVYDDGLFDLNLRRGVCLYDLYDAAQQILHCANFAHILRSQLIEFARHIIGIDVFEAGN